jgi:hypothetical protein
MAAPFAVAAMFLASLASASADTFPGANTTQITTPGTVGPEIASPYPSTITVSGMTGVVSDIDVRLHGYSDNFTPDFQVVLVAPNGTALLLMNAVGSSGAVTGLTVTWDDQAADHAPAVSPLTSGSFKPTDWDNSQPPNFPAPGPGPSWANPGPAGGSATLDGTFASSPPNGDWNLFVRDRSTSNGSLSSGWSMTLTTVPAPVTQPAPATKKCKKKKKKRSASAAKKCKKKKK